MRKLIKALTECPANRGISIIAMDASWKPQPIRTAPVNPLIPTAQIVEDVCEIRITLYCEELVTTENVEKLKKLYCTDEYTQLPCIRDHEIDFLIVDPTEEELDALKVKVNCGK